MKKIRFTKVDNENSAEGSWYKPGVARQAQESSSSESEIAQAVLKEYMDLIQDTDADFE